MCAISSLTSTFAISSPDELLLGKPRRRIKVSRPISPILTLKLVVMAPSLEPSGKEGQISHLRSNTYHMVKVHPVNPEIICLKDLF